MSTLRFLCFIVAFKSCFAISTIRITSDLERPVFLCAAPNDNERLFVLEQWKATVRIIQNGKLLYKPFIDLSDRVTNSGDERGLLGMAFDPNFAVNGRFYLHYDDKDGDSRISRFQVSSIPDSADINSEENLLYIEQPYSNHNGGMLAFGPDGYLYIGMGDGGAGGDPENRSQNLASALGKMLRIDVRNDSAYTIPVDNPFLKTPVAQPEIWSYGLRNPWRYCFDRLTGDLYIADVGQNEWEEIDFQPRDSKGGENYGWRIMEGKHCYNPEENCDQSNLVLPIWEYRHNQGCSITGGYVYRGAAIPGLQGHYFFADYCKGTIWSFRYAGGGILDFKDRTRELEPKNGGIEWISSFGEDNQGELYILDLVDGEVFKIIP